MSKIGLGIAVILFGILLAMWQYAVGIIVGTVGLFIAIDGYVFQYIKERNEKEK